ncbi:MAG: helix-turn-helix domain-containing protein [Pseudomonadota bacterium]
MVDSALNNAAKKVATNLLGSLSLNSRAVVIRDDDEGRGRRFYKLLKSELGRCGLKAIELADIQSVEGHIAREALRSNGWAPAGRSEILLNEKSLLSASNVLSMMAGKQNGKPLLFSFQNIGRWDRQTTMLVHMLLESGRRGSGKSSNGGSKPSAVVLVLEDDAGEEARDTFVREILGHPESLRFDNLEELSDLAAVRPIDSRAIRPLRLCQLAFLPLRVGELVKIEGAAALGNLKRCGVDFAVDGKGDAGVVRMTDGISTYLHDVSCLPGGQLADYHAKLLALFESRAQEESIFAARYYHAVKARRIESVFRWFDKGVATLLEKGKADQAVELLKESIGLVSSRQQSFGKEIHLRRRLAGIYADSSRPLQAFMTYSGGGFKNMTVEDWYRVARTSLEAGNIKQSLQAIESVLNGNRLDEGLLLPFKVLLGEVEYLRGNYDESRRICQCLRHNTLLEQPDRLNLANVEGKILLATGQFKKAEQTFQQNLKAAGPDGFHRQAVISKINIAVAKIRLGHYAAGRQWLGRALKDSRDRHFYREEAIVLENIATIDHLERNYGKALASYSHALDILKYLDCHELLARVANNMGELCIRFGDTGMARKMLDYSKERLDEIEGSLVEGEGLLLAGRISFLSANFADALEKFREAQEFFAAAKAMHLLIEAALWKVSAMTKCGLMEEAQESLGEIMNVLPEKSRLEAMFILHRARLMKEMGCAEPEMFMEAIDAFRKHQDREGEMEGLLEVTGLLITRGERDRALKLLKKAASVNNLIRCGVPQEQLERFDAMPVRKKLAALLKWAQGVRGPDRGSEKRTGGGAGKGCGRNNGKGKAVNDIMDNDRESGAHNSPAGGFDSGDGIDLRKLISEGISLPELKDRIEEHCIRQAMMLNNGNISKAADLLGMKRPRLSQLVKQYKLRSLKK